MADFVCRRQMRKHLLWKPARTLILLFVFALVLILYTKNGLPCDNSNEEHSKVKNAINKEKLKAYLLIVILTSPKGKERRDAIRRTWISDIDKLDAKVIHKFVVGSASLPVEITESLKEEATSYGDLLIFENFKDSYFHLTSKMLRTFKWIDQNAETSFVLKVDDDTFARLDVIIPELKSTSSVDRLYWGFFRGDANVKHGGQWAEKKWILCDHYLPFAQGGGYLLSSDLVHYIAINSELFQLYNSEDVSVGTWLAPLRINRVHDSRFDTEYRSRGCNNAHIVSHKQSIDNMLEKHQQLKENRKLCANEVQERKSFEYNWTVPPSQCCHRKSGVP